MHNRAWVEVNLSAIRSNIAQLSKLANPSQSVMAIVKADGYGHGIVPVAQAALEAGATWLGAATVAEGTTLRSAGIDAPICLLCAPAPGEVDDLITARLMPLLGDSSFLKQLVSAGCREAHLEIDTGMGRSGTVPEEAMALWRMARDAGIQLSGLCTHFSDADNLEFTLTIRQEAAFSSIRDLLESAGARFQWIHASNSAAFLSGRCAEANLIRPGLLLYGILPPNMPANYQAGVFQPALSLMAKVASVRNLSAGHPISYGASYILTRPSRVATVLIGYGDGYPRRLSNRGSMILHSRHAPILGQICMDQTVVDVTDIPADVKSGDIAICIGSDGNERITVEEIAAEISTTEHEITTCLTSRLPRYYIG